MRSLVDAPYGTHGYDYFTIRRVTQRTGFNREQLPVELGEIKNYCRVDHTEDDYLLNDLIRTATNILEEYLDKTFITNQYTVQYEVEPRFIDALWLPKEPLQSIDEFRYYNDDNTFNIWPSSEYYVDTRTSRIVANDGFVMPSADRQFIAYEVDYVAGYGDTPTDIPESIRTAIRQYVAMLYENREVGSVIPDVVKHMIHPYRRYHLF